MNNYFLIPTTEITARMINRSESKTLSGLAVRTINYQPYYVLEVTDTKLNSTDVFDYYTPYTQSEVTTATPPAVQARKIDIRGIFSDKSCAVNSTSTHSYSMPEDRAISEVWFEARTLSSGDTIDLTVTLADDTLVDQFVSSLPVPSGFLKLPIPTAIIAAGLKIKLHYNNGSLLTLAKFNLSFVLWRI